jgi:hypothetical protein
MKHSISDIRIERAPAGTFCVGAPDAPRLRPPGRPAAVMVFAPALGLAILAGFFILLI